MMIVVGEKLQWSNVITGARVIDRIASYRMELWVSESDKEFLDDALECISDQLFEEKPAFKEKVISFWSLNKPSETENETFKRKKPKKGSFLPHGNHSRSHNPLSENVRTPSHAGEKKENRKPRHLEPNYEQKSHALGKNESSLFLGQNKSAHSAPPDAREWHDRWKPKNRI
jgi:hypothetical protein